MTAFRYSLKCYISWKEQHIVEIQKLKYKTGQYFVESLSQKIWVSPSYEKSKLNEDLEMHSKIIEKTIGFCL